MKGIIPFVVFVIMLMVSKPGFAQDETTKPLDGLKETIEQIRVVSNTPGVAVVIIENGEVSLMEGFGYANLEKQVPVDVNTFFRIGSTSKMFVGLSALKLKEEGKLDFNGKLADLLPNLEFSNPWEAQAPIRLIHLLEHTTGWHDMHIAEFAEPGSQFESLADALAFHTDSRTSRWVPGSRMAYSNIGSAVTALVIEHIAGMPYEDYVQQHFFKPLKMHSATFFESEAYKQNAASLYMNDQVQPYWDILYRPAGSINAPISEMAKFLAFMLNGGATRTEQLIATESIREMEVARSTLGAEAGLQSGYGLANYTSGFGAYQVAFHGHNGAVHGGMADLSYSQELNSGYVALMNTSGPGLAQIGDAIKAYLLRDRVEPEVKSAPLPEHYQSLSGWYRPINSRDELSRYIVDVAGAMNFSFEGERFIRKPLFGGWQSNDYVNDDGLLVDVWTGLAHVAIVNDPLVGKAVAVGDALYQRVPSIMVFGPIVLLGGLGILSLIAFVLLLAHGIRILRKKQQAKLFHKVWSGPALASAYLLFSIVTSMLVGSDLSQLGSVNWVTLYMYVSSVVYPLMVLLAVWLVWRSRFNTSGIMTRTIAFTLLCLHVGTVLYLMNYDQIAIKLWS